MVDGKSDHFDTGEALMDVEKQAGIAAVEAIDRLRRVADEEQIIGIDP